MTNPIAENCGHDHGIEEGGVEPRPANGPVQILCDEIGFPFDRRMETDAVFVAFVRELVDQIADRLDMAEHIKDLTGKPPSEAAQKALALARLMLAPGLTADERCKLAADVHDHAHLTNPEEGPCDHDIDILSLCASAIRFGLERESTFRSRHALAAAQHVWRRIYGVTCFDSQMPAWHRNWVRNRMIGALVALTAEGTAA